MFIFKLNKNIVHLKHQYRQEQRQNNKVVHELFNEVVNDGQSESYRNFDSKKKGIRKLDHQTK